MITVEQDAREFGEHVRAGGWRLALLVARNVERGTAGRPPRNRPEKAENAKVSASEFARMAGLSGHDRVLNYLAAWERAALIGQVPDASELHPGSEVKLDEKKLGPFRVGEPTEPRVTVTAGGRWEPGGGNGSSGTNRVSSGRYVADGTAVADEPTVSVAGTWVKTAANALDSLASHRSSWRYLTAEDMEALAALPDVVSRIVKAVYEAKAKAGARSDR